MSTENGPRRLQHTGPGNMTVRELREVLGGVPQDAEVWAGHVDNRRRFHIRPVNQLTVRHDSADESRELMCLEFTPHRVAQEADE